MDDERFVGGWTRSLLAARTPEERYLIWKRARLLSNADGAHLAREIERLGLPYAEPGQLPEADPLRGRMRAMINAPDGRSACVEATLDGLPAIAGVDPMLNHELGFEYRRSDEAMATAAALVAELMRSIGYAEAGRKALPSRYVARSGAFWRRQRAVEPDAVRT